MVARRVADLDFGSFGGREYFSSPPAWEDEVLYFLLVDRFSDGNEDGTTPVLRVEDRGNAVDTQAKAAAWREAGGRFVGGNLRGLTSKMGYLQRLGVSAVWVSPVFRQVAFEESYHGYGIQNFLDVEPRFGTVDDLKAMVAAAHAHRIRVVLDIILNHTGNVFSYDPDRYPTGDGGFDPRWDGGPYRVAGFNAADGRPSVPFAPPAAGASTADGVWPEEMHQPAAFTAKARTDSRDNDPEFLEGDFFSLKDVHHGEGGVDDYHPSPALRALTRVYQWWIGETDIDGFRIDTVKHMDLGATRFFASSIHEFAQSIGKENFYLIGEITGGRQRAYDTLEVT